MKKIRILAAVLAVLMLPLALLFSCGTTEQVGCTNGEHTFPKKWETVQKRSCVLDEIEQATCKVCGFVKQRVANKATGHVFDPANKVSMNDATCTEDGQYIIECTWCTATQTEPYPGSKLGHKFANYEVIEGDEYIEKAFCVNCNAGTDTRILGINLDMEGERDHLTYNTMEIFTGTNGTSEYKTVNGSTALVIKRPAGDVIGSSAYGIVLSPRTDILENSQYVIEFEIDLTGATGNVTFTGTKAYGGQKMDFVTYNKEENRIDVAKGPAYAIQAGELAKLKIAVVTNDVKNMYDLYVNNVLVAASVGYIDDFYNGFGIGTFDIRMAEGNTASEIAIDNVKLYNGTKPEGYADEKLEVYDYYTTKTGEVIITFTLDADCDHTFEYKKVTTNCSASSYILKECTICKGGAVTQEFAPVEHKFKYSHTTAATCWTPGFECNVCTVCGERDGKQVEAQLQHQLGTDAVPVPPTCITPGYTIGNCIRCGYEWQDPSKNIPVLGHTINLESPNVKVVAADCTKAGYTEGPCVRCEKIIKPDELKVPALGHTCFNPTVIEATCSVAGYTQNKCDACATEYKTNELGKLAHTEFSRVIEGAIETKCIICGNSSQLPLVDIMPTSEKQLEWIAENGTLLLNASLDDGKAKNHGDVTTCASALYLTLGTATKARFQIVPRYSEWTLKNAAVGKYYSIRHVPYNSKLDDKTDTNHTYLNIYNYTGTASSVLKPYIGKTFIFEYNIKPNEYTFGGMTVEAIERSKKGYNGNVFSSGLLINDKGEIYATDARNGGNTLIGQIDLTNTKKWTRIAFALDTTNKTQSVYVDGVLMNTSKVKYNDNTFPYVEEFRCNFLIPNSGDKTSVGDADLDKLGVPQGDCGYDLDEVYVYIADQPLYITGLNRYDTAATNIADAANVEGESYLAALGAAKLGYTGAETWSAATEDGKNVVKYVKNGTGVQLPGALESNSSGIEITDLKNPLAWTNIDVKFPVVDGVTIDIMKGVRDYKKVIEVETPDTPETVDEDGTTDEGGEEVVEPQYEYYKEEQVYLVLENGYLKTNDGYSICKINANQWYNISFITREASGVVTYEVYVDGIYYRTCTATFTTGDLKETVSGDTITDEGCGPKTVFLAGKTNCQYTVSDISVYGNIPVPDVYKGRLESEIEIAGDETVIFQGAENFDVNTLVKPYNNSKGNLTSAVITVPGEADADPTSYLELKKAANEGIYAGYEVAKVGLNRKVGDEAGSDFRWTVKAGDFATNCGSNGKLDIFRFDNLEGVPASAQGGYDLSGYDKIRVRFFVEETDGYNILFYLHSGVDENGNDKFFYQYINVTKTGWMTVEIDIDKLGDDNKNADITNIDYISFYVGGWNKIAANEALKDGTTIYMESIVLIADSQVCSDTGYLKKDTACTEGHTFDAGTVVAPTCTTKGYTVKTCTLETCGVKEITDVVPATGHTNGAGEVVIDTPATCEKNGVKVTKFTCSACQAETYTNVVTVAGGHKINEGTVGKANSCTEDGYNIVTCSNANCDYAETVNEIRLVIPATGHTAGTTTTVVNATCENAGGTQTTCTTCNTPYIIEGTEVPALGHSMIDKAGSRVEPGCETEGSITKVCANNCGKEETTAIKATGHDMVETNRVPAANGVNGTITYTCANGCGATETATITAFPSVETMNALGDKIIASLTGEGIAAGSFKGDGSKNGINAAFAKWMTGTDATGSYLNVYAVPENGTVVSNYKVATTGATVLEFNVRANLDVFAGLKVKATIDGSEQTVLGIANTGKITFNGKVEETIDTTDTEVWTRIALVFDVDGKTIDFWFNGYYYHSMFFTAAYTVSDVTISVGEDADAGCGICLDDIYVFNGTAPVFNNGSADIDDAKITFDDKYFTYKGAEQNLNTDAWRDGVLKSGGAVYKKDFNAYRKDVTDTFYGEDAESTKTVLFLDKKAGNQTWGTGSNATGYDSWITIQSLKAAKSVHFSLTLKMNSSTNFSIIGCNRRTYNSGISGNQETTNPLEFTGTQFKFFGTVVAPANVGEWYKIDLYFMTHGTYEAVLYINDEYVAHVDKMPGKGNFTDEHPVKEHFIRAFNFVGGNKEKPIDVYVVDWDVNFDRKMPAIPAAPETTE